MTEAELNSLKENLCNAFCADVGIRAAGDLVSVSLPMTARDGDSFNVYLSRTRAGWRLSDAATTMMRLSYDNDLNTLLSGTRARLYSTILTESGLVEDDGEIYTEVPADQLIAGMFRLGQGLSRIEDIALWTRNRVESTFYNDLQAAITAAVPADDVTADYVPDFEGGADYLVDYRIETGSWPLFLFGVSGKDKARLTTITLLKLKQAEQEFDSIVVCNDISELPKADVSRLLAAANDVVPNVASFDSMREKINHHRRRAASVRAT